MLRATRYVQIYCEIHKLRLRRNINVNIRIIFYYAILLIFSKYCIFLNTVHNKNRKKTLYWVSYCDMHAASWRVINKIWCELFPIDVSEDYIRSYTSLWSEHFHPTKCHRVFTMNIVAQVSEWMTIA